MRSLISVFAFLFLATLAGCNITDSSHNNSDEYDKVRENVWTYVQSTEMPQNERWKNAWLNGKVEEIKWSGEIANYIELADKYQNETLLLVIPSFKKEPMAYPRILVEPETKEVISEIPGE